MTWFEYMRKRLEPPSIPDKKFSISDLECQWSDQFERLMRNRLMMGTLRYGDFIHRKTTSNYKIVLSIKQRLELYNKTGNTEHLVDIANLCMVEFVCGYHPTKHFSASDDAIHVKNEKQYNI